jgi:aryl-alcohol dehydrogenase-like predicted oxidoreductase
VQQRTLADRSVGAIGLGAMPLSVEGRPDRERAVRTVHAALDAGVTLIDTADAYCLTSDEVGHNESLVAEALASWGGDRDAVLIATKGGHTRPPDDSWAQDGSPAHLRAACEASLRALGVEAIDLYQYHRPDPKVPYEDSVGTLAELRQEGKIRLVGISNADPDQIRLAASITPIASVQNELSPAFRSSLPELELCTELGIAFLPWSPLGGIGKASDLGAKHAAFGAVAEQHGVSPQQVCLAWLLALSPVCIPIPGSSRPESIRDSAAAVDLRLTAEELEELSDGWTPAAGSSSPWQDS